MPRLPRRAFLGAMAAAPALAHAAAPPLPQGAHEIRRGPYLQCVGPDRAVVRWRTGDATAEGRVRFGPPDDLTRVATASVVRTPFRNVVDWQAELTGLDPSTTYGYAVEAHGVILAGGDDAHVFRTAPKVGQRVPMRFWALGDCGTNRPGTGNPGKAVAARNGFRRYNKGRPLDGMLLLGDNAYSHGTDAQYQTALFGLYREDLPRLPLWPCIGNHEMSDDYYHLFTTPTRGYYAFDWGNVHFVVLDLFKDKWRDPADPQRKWLSRVLKTAQDWTVVINHFPPYCAGKYDSDKIAYLGDVRTKILPVLEAAGVDLFLVGHDHTYQRSWLLDGHHGKGDTFDAVSHLKALGDGARRPWTKRHGPHSGMVTVVSGTAGAEDPLAKPDKRGGKLDHPAMVPLADGDQGGRGLRRLGTFLLEVDGLELTGTQIDDRGRIADRFRLAKRR